MATKIFLEGGPAHGYDSIRGTLGYCEPIAFFQMMPGHGALYTRPNGETVRHKKDNSGYVEVPLYCWAGFVPEADLPV